MNEEKDQKTQNKNNFGDDPLDLMSDGGFETERKKETIEPKTPEVKKEIAEPTSGMGLIGSNKRNQEQINELYELVKKKTENYDPEAEKEGASEFDTKEQISWV